MKLKILIILLLLFFTGALKIQAADKFPITIVGSTNNTVVINPLTETWTIQYTGTNIDLKESQLAIRAWNCDLYVLSDCTTPTEQNPWSVNGVIKKLTGGTLVNTPPSTIPTRVYYAQFKPYNPPAGITYDWSDTVAIGMTKNKVNLTNSEINALYYEAVNAYFAKYPYKGIAGHSVGGYTTIAQIEASSLSEDKKTEYKGILACGPTPSETYGTMSFDDWQLNAAKFRKCNIEFYHYLNMVEFFHYLNGTSGDLAKLKERVTRNAYFMLEQFDMMLTKKGEMPLGGYYNSTITYPDGTPNASFTVGENWFAKEYVTDFGMGLFKSLGWGNQLGLVNSTHCSEYEGWTNTRPEGGPCISVNIANRVLGVTKKIFDKETPEYIASLSIFKQSRHYAGKYMAGRLNNIIFNYRNWDIAETNTMTSTIAHNLDVSNFESSGVAFPRIPNDLFQHHDTLYTINDWAPLNTSSPFIANNNGFYLLKVFRDAYLYQGEPYFRDDADSYDAAVLAKNSADANNIGACKESGKFFHYTPDNKIVGLRGQAPSNEMESSTVAVKQIAEVINPFAAEDIKGLLVRALKGLKANPTGPDSENCDPAPNIASNIAMALRSPVFMIHGIMFWNKILVKEYNGCLSCPNGTLPKQGDANCDGFVNSIDFNIWKKTVAAGTTMSNMERAKANFSCQNNPANQSVGLDDFLIWSRKYGTP